MTTEDYRKLYPQAKIVLNHVASDDLNFRVFEALGCGACLITPFVRHGLEDLFQNGKKLFIFDQTDINSLVKLVQTLLATPALRQKAAISGHGATLAGHYGYHRAQAFASRIEELITFGNALTMVNDRLKNAHTICSTWLRRLYLHHAETTESLPHRALYYNTAQKYVSKGRRIFAVGMNSSSLPTAKKQYLAHHHPQNAPTPVCHPERFAVYAPYTSMR